ncbi:hypothetical protein Ancab_037701 [Ancistrocladus abbreviatus]
MSILSSIVVSLLFFSLNVGAARLLGVVDNELQKRIHLSIKNKVEVNLGKVAAPTPMASATITGKDNAHDTVLEKNQHHEEELKGAMPREDDESEHQKIDGEASSSTKSKFEAVRISWLVPHKKRGVPQPGFNLDYAPPKEHPPEHN